MADARMPERFLLDRRINRLSDKEFRAYVTGMIWSVSNRTDGEIGERDLETVPRVTAALANALVDADLWERTVDGWLIVDYGATQTTRAEFETMENMRRREREKKRRQRAKKAGIEGEGDVVPGDVPGDVSPGTTQARPPLGKAFKETESKTENAEADEKPSKFCAKHRPYGTSDPCGPCGDARTTFDDRLRDWQKRQNPIPWEFRQSAAVDGFSAECLDHPGYYLPCHRCARDAALEGEGLIEEFSEAEVSNA